MARSTYRHWIVFAGFLILVILAWDNAHTVRARWANVPPVPSVSGFTMFALGDPQMAYRVAGLVLQNLGNTGGRSEPFAQYDYTRLQDWFFLTHALDPRADFVPALAAYYFGATKDPGQLVYVTDYLAIAGNAPQGQKWRWLAQAVYLRRYVMQDLPGAYALSEKLAAIDNPAMPMWTRQMPALIMTAQGDRRTSYGLMLRLLRDSIGKVDSIETNFMLEYICLNLADVRDAESDDLCRSYKNSTINEN